MQQFDQIGFERNLDNYRPPLHCYYWIRRLQALFFAGDFASAVDASSRARPLLWTLPSIELAEYAFYSALARAALWNSASEDQRPEHLDALAAHCKQLQIWAEHCPANFQDRAELVGAEIARIEGRDLEAARLYEEAIGSARKNGFVQNEGLAHELAAQYYLARGLETAGYAHLRSARNCFDRWGAHGKVKQLDERYPPLQEKRCLCRSGCDRPASRTARRRGCRESFAGTFERDCPSHADREAGTNRGGECRCRAGFVDPDPGPRASESKPKPPRATTESRLRSERQL